MDWRLKLAIAVGIIIVIMVVAPGLLGDIFMIVIDTFKTCDGALRDIDLPNPAK